MSMTDKPKRFLLNTQFKWPYSPVDYSLAMALRQRGNNVRMIACGGLPYCELETITQSRPSCGECLNNLVADFAKFNLPYYVIRDLLTKEEVLQVQNSIAETSLADLLILEVNGFPAGRIAWLNLFQYFRGFPFEITGKREEVYRRAVNSTLLLFLAKTRIVDNDTPDMIITVNGKFLMWSPLIHLARQRNISFATWEDIAVSCSGTIISVNDIAHEQRIDRVWEKESEKVLSQYDRKELFAHFKDQSVGKTSRFQYYDENTLSDVEIIRRHIELRENTPVVSLFTNSSWDSSAVGLDRAFDNMFDWIFQVIAYATKRSDVEFIIRAHPAEGKLPDQYKSSTPVCEAIRARYPNLPDNIKLIDGSSTISSYAIGSISNVVMVYTTTLGIEFALKGKRPWVAARPYYSDKGFTLDLKSPQHMLGLLDSNLFDNRLTPQQIALAERFAHMVRFRRVFPFPYIDGFSGTFTPPGRDAFAPGTNPIIDNVCNYLLIGEPFLDIGWRTICADDNLANIKEIAQTNRFGYWQIKFRGFTIYCHDILSFYMAAKDIFLNRIYDFTSRKQRPRIVDGGGHLGLFTLFARQKYPDAQITVFEPDEESLQLLKYNLDANGASDVTVVKAGLYSHEGTLPFGSDRSDGSSLFFGDKNTRINVVCLSHYIDAEIDFLKLNVEGAELEVLAEIESKLPLVKELVMEYHGFPEIDQNLHKLLNILTQAGFRYLIHDFDGETNPATKPPFTLEANTRYFLLIYAKRLFPSAETVNHNHLQPISRVFGIDRGTPIDRYYIEKFLEQNSACIRGCVLEIGDNIYTRKYGSDVLKGDVLNAVPSPNATIVGDFTNGNTIPELAFDCIIMTQTIQVIYDVKAALKNAMKALKPGGTLLLTASGISQISRYDMDRWGEYWRFTDKSLKMLLSECVPEDAVCVESFGNVAVAQAFLDGLAAHEISKEVLDYRDVDYQVLLTAWVRKPGKILLKELIPSKIPEFQSPLLAPLVLLYHRIADDPIDAQLLAVSPEHFEEHLRELAENYRTVPLHQLLEELRHNILKANTIALTFDDGYLDNLTNAIPLLEKYGLHATIFVTSGMVGSDEEFWWDQLERIFLAGDPLPDSLSITTPEGMKEWDLTKAEGRLRVLDELGNILRGKPYAKIKQFINILFEQTGITKEARHTHRIVNSGQLKELSQSTSIEIGSHAITHTRLSILPPKDQRLEISESRRRLESIIQKPVRFFSYPFGTMVDFTTDTEKIVKEDGYEAGIANIQGYVVDPINRYSVPRRLVRNWSGEVFARWLKDEDKNNLEYQTVSARKNLLREYQKKQKQHP